MMVRMYCAMVFQQFNLYPHMNVLQNILTIIVLFLWVICSPLRETSPLSGSSSALMHRMRVLLPEPDGPIIVIFLPSFTYKLMFLNTCKGPKDLQTLFNRIIRASYVKIFSNLMIHEKYDLCKCKIRHFCSFFAIRIFLIHFMEDFENMKIQTS